MNYTTYYNLQKPLNTETYDINIQNANADIIDSALNRLAQKNNSQDNALNNEINRAIDRENEISSSVETLAANVDAFSICTISGITDATGHLLVNADSEGRIPVAAVPVVTPVFSGAIIVHTGNYYAKLVHWNDTGTAITNTAVTLIVLYAKI